MATEHAILTPEKVAVSFPLAGAPSRVMAHLIDLIVLGLFSGVLVMAVMIGIGTFEPGLAQAVMMWIFAFGAFIYFSVLEGLWNGQTLGKYFLRLRVRMADGTPVTFSAALFRNLLRPADFLPGFYLVGIVCMSINPRLQRIGDLGAGTVVVHEQVRSPRFSVAPHRFGTHPFEEHVGELRGMTAEEYMAIKRLCDRYPELPKPVQEHMLSQIWVPFAAKHSIEPLANVHPVYLMEAVVMRYSRRHGLL